MNQMSNAEVIFLVSELRGSQHHRNRLILNSEYDHHIHGDYLTEEGLSAPRKVVNIIRDLIYWQYAKAISESAGFGKKQFAFVAQAFHLIQDEAHATSRRAPSGIVSVYASAPREGR